MRFKLLTLVAILFVALADYLVLPSVLLGLRSNSEIRKYLADPDLTFQFFGQCKKRVTDADACYQAYSAAVQLANLKGCSSESITLKRRFKLLVEHNTLEVVESEIVRECSSSHTLP